MLKAIPKHWFSWDFRVMDGTRQVADMDLSFWRRKELLSIEGTPYQVFREGLVSGTYILETGGAVAARAEKPNALRRSFLIEHEGRQLILQASSVVGRAFASTTAKKRSDRSPRIGSLLAGQQPSFRKPSRFP